MPFDDDWLRAPGRTNHPAVDARQTAATVPPPFRGRQPARRPPVPPPIARHPPVPPPIARQPIATMPSLWQRIVNAINGRLTNRCSSTTSRSGSKPQTQGWSLTNIAIVAACALLALQWIRRSTDDTGLAVPADDVATHVGVDLQTEIEPPSVAQAQSFEDQIARFVDRELQALADD